MSPTQELLLVAVGLYLLECLIIVPRNALLFAARGLAALRIIRADSLVGSVSHGGHLAMPLPPLGVVFVAEPWAIALSPKGICSLPDGCFGGPASNSPVPEGISFDDLQKCTARGNQLCLNDQPYLTCVSEYAAGAWCTLIRSVHAAPAADRAALIAAALRERCDAAEVALVATRAGAATGGIRLICNLLLVYLFGLAPAAIWRYGVVNTWLLLLLGLLPLWLGAVVAYHVAHRGLYPARRGQRWLHMLTSTLLPIGAIRAVDAITRDALVGFHPAAIARALCRPDVHRAYLQELLADAIFSPPAPADLGGEIRTWFRALLRRELGGLAHASGLTLDQLHAPPEADSGDCQRWCPRCRGQFVISAPECPTCPGVALRAFTTPTLVGNGTITD